MSHDETYARGGRARSAGEKVTSQILASPNLQAGAGRLSEGATPSLPRVSRLALRFLPSENFGRPHTEKMGSHARR